jgi:hypothetical protein
LRSWIKLVQSLTAMMQVKFGPYLRMITRAIPVINLKGDLKA